MAPYLVRFERKDCMGTGSCVNTHPTHWILTNLGKAELIGSAKKLSNNIVVEETLEINELELNDFKRAAMACPAKAIQIIDLKTKKQVI